MGSMDYRSLQASSTTFTGYFQQSEPRLHALPRPAIWPQVAGRLLLDKTLGTFHVFPLFITLIHPFTHRFDMGTTPSKPATEFTEKQRQQVALAGQARVLADSLATLDLNGIATSQNGSLEGSNLAEWEHAVGKVGATDFGICHYLQLFRTQSCLFLGQYYHIRISAPACSSGHRLLRMHSSSTTPCRILRTLSQISFQVVAAGYSLLPTFFAIRFLNTQSSTSLLTRSSS